MFEQAFLAYGWWFGWFWWWWFAIFVIFWLMLFEPFAWGRGWYLSRYGGQALRSAHSTWDVALSHYMESPETGLTEADAIVGPLVQRAPGGAAASEYAVAHETVVAARQGAADERRMREAMAVFLRLYNALA